MLRNDHSSVRQASNRILSFSSFQFSHFVGGFSHEMPAPPAATSYRWPVVRQHSLRDGHPCSLVSRR